jgi:uncharacterized protein (UPF0548 family)
MVRGGLRRGGEVGSVLQSLHERSINYHLEPAQQPTRAAGWHFDTVRHALAREAPGPPAVGGPFQSACQLVRDYEFVEPGILRAAYRGADDLLGRDMLLEGRFFGLRFYLGVRITTVIDQTRGTGAAAQQVWGWSYQTLEGHLEQGQLNYEVIKHLHTGDVEFVITGYSRAAPIPNPIIRVGFALFGRWTQQRFYRASVRRLHTLVHAALAGMPLPTPATASGDDSLVIVPSHTKTHLLQRLSRRRRHRGTMAS